MKRYIITTAVPGCEPNAEFLAAIDVYKKKNKATLIIIEAGRMNKKDLIDESLVPFMLPGDIDLNSNIGISAFPVSPYKVDPITGFDRLSHNEHSTIYGSPKQRLKSVASPGDALPRVLMTPGACTRAKYLSTSVRSLAAYKDHVIGAIIVEIIDDKYYHFRQVQADKSGAFVDWGVQYSSTGTSRMKTEAVIPGDWHTGYTDPVVKKAVISILKDLKPKYLFLHDLFDGISVNHHIEHKLLLRSMLGPVRRNVALEISMVADELDELSKYVQQTLVVKSNHDEFLDRWLEEGNFIHDNENRVTGLELALSKAQGKDPLEAAIRKAKQKLRNVSFLNTDESFKITPRNIECGQHGHLGSNGARGSAVGLEKSYLNAVTGHTHSPEILRGLWTMGTSSYLRLSYNKGPSSWMQTLCLVYADGSRQLINIINGEVRA